MFEKRPPVVAVLGHVDHGKSSLLDYIRKSNIIDSEHGGITQHLGAYEAIWVNPNKIEQKITFLDTPGHESFCSMRKRGVCLSDIAILIVSAEESVKAQTIEAKNSIEENGLPYLVAINKIDRPNANPEKVKQDLAENGIFLESYGGKIPSVNISAKTGEGVDELLDVLFLMAEMEDLKGNPQAPAEGFVLENNLDPKTGISATLVIKNGHLKNGDWLAVAGQAFRIKKIENDQGQIIKKATFSSPVKILGWKELPPIGESFTILKNKKEAENYEKNFTKLSKNNKCLTIE
ncbi:MAG TPA: GTP-binding protein, partial [Candidatus Vogelbacteria bacterium]|nr:GTP-binding protein [Candidatus Vogelbacteria bacterium]